MIKCPKCSATLPDGAGYCQFCQATFLPTQPSRAAQSEAEQELGIASQPTWVWPAYYAIAGWWIASGLFNIIADLVRTGSASPFVILVNGLSALIGLCLVLKVEFIRKLVNVVCFFNIVFGLFGVIGTVFSPAIKGLFGLIYLLIQAVGIASAGFMIYLLGETDTQAPNF